MSARWETSSDDGATWEPLAGAPTWGDGRLYRQSVTTTDGPVHLRKATPEQVQVLEWLAAEREWKLEVTREAERAEYRAKCQAVQAEVLGRHRELVNAVDDRFRATLLEMHGPRPTGLDFYCGECGDEEYPQPDPHWQCDTYKFVRNESGL